MKVVIWKCKNCKRINVSYAREHHCMDMCFCKQSGMDLEYYRTRYLGEIKIIGKLDDEDYAPWIELSLGYMAQYGGFECTAEIFKQIKHIRDQINIEISNGISRV